MLVVLFAVLGVVSAVMALGFWWSDDPYAHKPTAPDPLLYRPLLFGALAAGAVTICLALLRDFFTRPASLAAFWLCVLPGLALPALAAVAAGSELASHGPAESVLVCGGVLFLLAARSTWKRRSTLKGEK